MPKQFVFVLQQHPCKKGMCPKCGKTNCFRYYENLPLEYGICDHINKCNYHKNPYKQSKPIFKKLCKMQNNQSTTVEVQEPIKIIYPDTEQLQVLNKHTSIFHEFCINALKVEINHLKLWNVGADKYGNTAFVLQDITGKMLNIKFIKYDLLEDNKDCKRNKQQNPFYLKTNKNEKYKTCLFGEHLVTDNKIICLVESEKTAVVSSFFYPKHNWLATGGSNGLTVDKVQILKDKTIYYLGDNDKAGKENSTLNKLQGYGINYKIITFENAKEGEDIADLIIRGERPEIKPTEGVATKEKKEITADDKPKNNFTILRDYMLETWDFQYNLVRNEIEYKLKVANEYIILNDADVYIHLRENNIQFKKEDFTAILRSSIMGNYNPINKYFDSLPSWDLKTDHIDNLISYLKYNGTIDIKTHFKKWIVRAVKCAIDDKYFNKQIFVLIGKQNDGKSTFVRFLVPQELENYYIENPDFKSKDGEISLTQNFIINMDELANIGKEDTDKLKTFISKIATNVRRPYEKNTRSEPRKASFMGTTNNDEFLTDHTGNVRWLNFKIDGIDFNYSKNININDVWTQAYYLYKQNYCCDISNEELQEIEKSNQEFKIQTLEMQVVKDYFVIPYEQNAERIKFMTATDIINHIETINPKYKNLNIQKIGNAMVSLGYKKENRRVEKHEHPKKGYWVYLK